MNPTSAKPILGTPLTPTQQVQNTISAPGYAPPVSSTPMAKVVPPPLTAQFKASPTTPVQPSAVTTSAPARSAISSMATTIGAANNDIANNQNFQASQVPPPPEPTPAPTPVSQDPTVALLNGLGIDTTGMTPDQIATVADDSKAISDQQQQAQVVSDTLNQMSAGNYPLSSTEQAQINDVGTQYAGVIAQVQDAAKNLATGASVYNAKGEAMYTPGEAATNIANAIKTGNTNISKINTQLLDAQSKLTTAFQNGDYKNATALYNSITANIKARNDEISAITKTVTDAQTKLATTQATTQKDVNSVMLEAAKNGASPQIQQAIANAPDYASAIMAAGDSLNGTATGVIGEYNFYKNQATQAGQIPMSFADYQVWNANLKQKSITPASSSTGSGAGSTGPTAPVTSTNQLDTQLQPYSHQTADGTVYVDLSSASAATRDKLTQLAGTNVPIIGDRQTAIDMTNIKSSQAHLQTLANIFKDVSSTSALRRDLGGAGLSELQDLAQSDPKKAAANATTILAMSLLTSVGGIGGSGGRGQKLAEDVQNNMPKITDTQDVVAQKLNTIKQLLEDNENSILGTNISTPDIIVRSQQQAEDAVTKYASSANPDQQKAITTMSQTVNPKTGQPYSALEIAQVLGIQIPALPNSYGISSGGLIGSLFSK